MNKVTLNYQDYKTINELHRENPGRFGIYTDVETTGLSAIRDEIISISMLPVFIGDITVFAPPVTFYNDPGFPIPRNITWITGITNEMVAGKKAPYEKIQKSFLNAGMIFAHKCNFDRGFIEQAIPDMKSKFTGRWLCSCDGIDWKTLIPNIPNCKLTTLTQAFNAYYNAHRSEADCEAGCFVLSQVINGKSGFERLMGNLS